MWVIELENKVVKMCYEVLDEDDAKRKIPKSVLDKSVLAQKRAPIGMIYIEEGIYETTEVVPEMPVIPPDILDYCAMARQRISGCCSGAIYQGTDVTLTRGTRHYTFVEKAQTDLGHMMNQIAVGTLKFSYKADNEDYNLYTDVEIKTIYKAMTEWITINTAYYEKLKSWLTSIEATGTDADIELVKSIHYGSALPEAFSNELVLYLRSLDIDITKLLSLLS